MAPRPSGLTTWYLPIRPEKSWRAGDSGWRSAASLMGSPRTEGGSARSLLLPGLPRDREVRAAVACPALLARLLAERDFLAVGDGLQPGGVDAQGDQIVEGGAGA